MTCLDLHFFFRFSFEFLSRLNVSHTICDIFASIWFNFMVNVGEYTSPMDAMGIQVIRIPVEGAFITTLCRNGKIGRQDSAPSKAVAKTRELAKMWISQSNYFRQFFSRCMTKMTEED